jgi:hypothetical protein
LLTIMMILDRALVIDFTIKYYPNRKIDSGQSLIFFNDQQ